MHAEQVIAFRLARSGLVNRDAGSLAEAAACPVSDFARDSALFALAARREDLTRETYEQAVDQGELVVAHIIRGSDKGWVLSDDAPVLDSPPEAKGIRLIPPGDPFLGKPNRSLLAPDVELRKRLFRPVASPGAVLEDGRLVGLWRVKAKGKKAEITVEKLGRLARADLEPEVQRIADLRGAAQAALVLH